jgi:hypothetical protein
MLRRACGGTLRPGSRNSLFPRSGHPQADVRPAAWRRAFARTRGSAAQAVRAHPALTRELARRFATPPARCCAPGVRTGARRCRASSRAHPWPAWREYRPPVRSSPAPTGRDFAWAIRRAVPDTGCGVWWAGDCGAADMDVRARLNAMDGDTAGGAIPCLPDDAAPEPAPPLSMAAEAHAGSMFPQVPGAFGSAHDALASPDG